MPVFARGHTRFSPLGNGQTGICPFDKNRATGIRSSGHDLFANGWAKAGIEHAR